MALQESPHKTSGTPVITGLNQKWGRRKYRSWVIPKPGGGERLLGIPTAADRVIQQAMNIRDQSNIYALT